MANNYKLKINKLEVKTAEGDLTNVVFLVHFSYIATTEDEQYSETALGMASIASPDPENFTNFEDLTEEQVQGWVESVIDFELYKQNLNNAIEEKINPTKQIKDTPW